MVGEFGMLVYVGVFGEWMIKVGMICWFELMEWIKEFSDVLVLFNFDVYVLFFVDDVVDIESKMYV